MTNDNAYDEFELLALIKAGDEAAFNALFGKYRNQLFIYLFKITKSREASEEIVLDVFLKIWLGRDIVDQIRNFENFLFRVAHNKAIDFLRAVQRNPARQNDLFDLIQEAASDLSADSKLHESKAEEAINEAIDLLPTQRQKVFLLSREEGLSYDQIADHMDISRHTVRNHMAAALEFIRTHLKKQGFEMTALVYFMESCDKVW